jgi:predicted component of type VI protein secretion system
MERCRPYRCCPYRSCCHQTCGERESPSSSPFSLSWLLFQKEKSAATAPAVSPAIQKGFLNKASAKTKPPATSPAAASSPATTAPLVQVLSTDDQPSPEVKRAPAPPASGPTSPEFTMTERGILNIGDFGAGGGMQVSSTRPAELVYRIDIPLVAKTSQVELDVGERSVSSLPSIFSSSREPEICG